MMNCCQNHKEGTGLSPQMPEIVLPPTIPVSTPVVSRAQIFVAGLTLLTRFFSPPEQPPRS